MIDKGEDFGKMNWLRRFMAGRYGTDQLSYVLLGACLVLMLLARMTRWGIFQLLAFAVLALCYLRVFSRNTSRRYAENMRFLQYWKPISQRFSGMAATARESKAYCHLKCPNCGQKIRVPRGRGKISITCPGCRQQFVKKT